MVSVEPLNGRYVRLFFPFADAWQANAHGVLLRLLIELFRVIQEIVSRVIFARGESLTFCGSSSATFAAINKIADPASHALFEAFIFVEVL